MFCYVLLEWWFSDFSQHQITCRTCYLTTQTAGSYLKFLIQVGLMLGLRICISKKLPRFQVMPMLLFQIPCLDHLTHFIPSPLSLTFPYTFSLPSHSADNYSSYFSENTEISRVDVPQLHPTPFTLSTSLPFSAIVEEVPLLSEANSSSYVLTLHSQLSSRIFCFILSLPLTIQEAILLCAQGILLKNTGKHGSSL